ncbi:MAG: pyruvate kinase [Candidatus Caldatribacteriaceae bacterium]
MRRTKIVCTVGPSSLRREIIRELICAGMDVARINFSYGDVSFYREAFCLVREEAEFLGKSVAVLGDLQGVKLRIGGSREGCYRT